MNQLPRRIGFVDYNLNNFHADVLLSAIRGPLKSRGFDVGGAWALDRDPSQVWAAKNDVAFYDKFSALDAVVDYFMVLAPSHPETHQELCERVFPCGKTTYVDKTFAPDSATAQRIFALADKYGISVQTSSALRYTNVQEEIRNKDMNTRHLTVWGGGTSFEEYGIHVLEMAVSCFGATATGLAKFGSEKHPLIVLQFDNARTASLVFNASNHTPYEVAITTESGVEFLTVNCDLLFVDTASAILDFFEANMAQINRDETLLIREIMDALEQDPANGVCIPLKNKLRHVSSPKYLLGRKSPMVTRASETENIS